MTRHMEGLLAHRGNQEQSGLDGCPHVRMRELLREHGQMHLLPEDWQMRCLWLVQTDHHIVAAGLHTCSVPCSPHPYSSPSWDYPAHQHTFYPSAPTRLSQQLNSLPAVPFCMVWKLMGHFHNSMFKVSINKSDGQVPLDTLSPASSKSQTPMAISQC